MYVTYSTLPACLPYSGRLEETEEELVQVKIERETERQRKAKFGSSNGAAVAAVNSEMGEEEGEGDITGGEGLAEKPAMDVSDKGTCIYILQLTSSSNLSCKLVLANVWDTFVGFVHISWKH